MDFLEVIEQARNDLQRKGRISYRALKMAFALDDEQLAVLKEELIDILEVAADKDGKMLVWTGNGEATGASAKPESPSQSPASYTPQHLAERILAEQAAMESRGSANGERKTITALFADLKGSTALIEGLDPEDARAIIDPALQLMMDAVHRYDGYVAQALGDGIFALFGAPIAHEDHPQRALYAALRMQEEMRGYADTLRQQGRPPLLMRVGLNTGEVVVRSIRKDDLHADYVPVGHSTNLAARMEQLAAPGSIVVTDYTHKLTDGYFAFKDLGKTQIKGVEAPLNVYEVIGAGPLRTRLQVSARRGLSRFVGRHSELDQMQRTLAQAKAGHGQIVGVVGEPGLGKSRLFYEFKLTSQSGCLVLEAFAVSHGQASPYLPLIELLKDYFAIEPADEERKRREKITGKVLALDRALEETLPYLFSLLGIEDEQASLQQMDASIRRQRTFEALKKLFLRESLNQPLLLLFEDLHWLDTETQGVLDTLSESVASAPLLLVANYRPEYCHEWGQKTYYTQLRLAPLGHAEAKELLTFLLGDDVSLTALKPLILEKTEGTPFFLEEVVQTLVEEGALIGERGSYRLEQAPTALHIPATVQGVLAARIDRLTSEEKELLQQLAVIGRQFPVSLVKHVVPQSEAELYRVLASLQAKEFLYEQPAFPEVEYIFKHALTQEVAYGTVLQEQRKQLHEQTGHAMEALYSDNLEDHYSDLAHHYSRSENTDKAIAYLHLAGQQAIQHSANEEAIRYLSAALDVLRTQPDSSEHTQQELVLLTALGQPLIAARGFTAPEVEQVYDRALTLCQQADTPSHLFPALHGSCNFYLSRGDLQTARGLGEQLLTLAHAAHDASLLSEASYSLGATLYCLGDFVSAQPHLEQGVGSYDAQQHRGLAFQYGQDPAVICLCYTAWLQWVFGYPVQSQTENNKALTLARELAHPFSLAIALARTGMLHQVRREEQAAQEQAEALVTLSHEQGFSYWALVGMVHHGWALAEQGQGETGLAQMREGLAALRSTGTELYLPYMLALLAEAAGKTGNVEEGLRAVAEAKSIMDRTGERQNAAELNRLQGDLLLLFHQQSRVRREAESEACFCKALDIARQQQAKSWELRAATRLARLWQQQGKTIEARELLTSIYDWFTEGFDTLDLKEAKALLTELLEGV